MITSSKSPGAKKAAEHSITTSIMRYRRVMGTPQEIINLARDQSKKAVGVLVEILEDVEMPAVVRVKCAELLLERGYGKAPQAVLISDGTDPNKAGVHALSIMDRISLLKAAKDAPSLTDLEANDITEVDVTEDPDSPI